MAKRAHGKNSVYQKEHIPKSAHFVYIEVKKHGAHAKKSVC